MPSERRTNSSVRRPDASWRHTTNHKFATETRAICWLVGAARARNGIRGKSSKDLSRETATRRVTLKRREQSCSRQTYHAGDAMSEKGNVLCCFLSTCLHFLPNFRRCDARQAARPWPGPQICWDSSSCNRCGPAPSIGVAGCRHPCRCSSGGHLTARPQPPGAGQCCTASLTRTRCPERTNCPAYRKTVGNAENKHSGRK
jgi:hypothetical protein